MNARHCFLLLSLCLTLTAACAKAKPYPESETGGTTSVDAAIAMVDLMFSKDVGVTVNKPLPDVAFTLDVLEPDVAWEDDVQASPDLEAPDTGGQVFVELDVLETPDIVPDVKVGNGVDVPSPVVIVDTTSSPTTKADTSSAPDVAAAVDTVKKPKDVATVDVPVVVPDTGPTAPDVTQPAPDVKSDVPPPPAGLVYGLTLDAVDSLPSIVDALKSLPVKPWVRIVFDYQLMPADYAAAVTAIAPYAEIVGQPSDSTYNAQMTVDQYRTRFQAYVTAFPQITIWEVCNECNGDWLGANASAQADAAMDVVKAAGKKALFTPYWNTATCADAHGLYVPWIQKNISAAVKSESDYVMPSIYGSDCDGPEPSYAELDAMVQTFADMFPNAQVGIGEYGKPGDAAVLKYFLGYTNANPRYIFAGLYWYGKQDLVPKTKTLWTVFSSSMK